MPRTARLTPGGFVYHVLNRANAGIRIFKNRADYVEFVQAMTEAGEHVPIRILCWCLMPDHWHLVLWPRRTGEMSNFMRRLSVTHTRRWHARRSSAGTGHLYQGRYRSFPVQEDDHLHTVCRYVEANPVRSELAGSAAEWPWSSLAEHSSRRSGAISESDGVERPELSPWPFPIPRNWARKVDAEFTPEELEAIRKSVQRGTPFGSTAWQAKVANQLNLHSTMRPRGRPRKTPVSEEPAPRPRRANR